MALDAFIAAWNSHDPTALAACYREDGVRVQIAEEPTRFEGRDAIAAHVAAILTAWPDSVLTTRGEVLQSGNVHTLEWTFSGTQQADYGPLPGNGQALVLNGVSVITMDGDLVRTENVYWDTATLMATAGLFPPG